MKKLLVILATSLLLNGVTYAEEKAEKAPETSLDTSSEAPKQHKPCEKSCDRRKRLTNEQKEKLREAVFKFKENKIQLEKDIKLARLNFDKLASDPSSDAKMAKAAAQEIADHVSKMVAAKFALKTQILFQILTPEQRKEKFFHQIHKGGHWGHHGKKSQGPHGKHDEASMNEEESNESGPMLSMEDSNDEENEDEI